MRLAPLQALRPMRRGTVLTSTLVWATLASAVFLMTGALLQQILFVSHQNDQLTRQLRTLRRAEDKLRDDLAVALSAETRTDTLTLVLDTPNNPVVWKAQGHRLLRVQRDGDQVTSQRQYVWRPGHRLRLRREQDGMLVITLHEPAPAFHPEVAGNSSSAPDRRIEIVLAPPEARNMPYSPETEEDS